MRFVNVLAAVALLATSAFAHADLPDSLNISLSADLNIAFCESEGGQAGMCSTEASSNTTIGMSLGRLGDGPMSGQYQGTMALVRTRDGLRYIGVITVNAMALNPNDPHSIMYNFDVEIVGAHGTEAEMTISVDDPAKLNTAWLTSDKKVVGNRTYSATFFVGPGPATRPKSLDSSEPWHVRLGSLR
jgi:hypothetical protein